jgi:hypothetical protein
VIKGIVMNHSFKRQTLSIAILLFIVAIATLVKFKLSAAPVHHKEEKNTDKNFDHDIPSPDSTSESLLRKIGDACLNVIFIFCLERLQTIHQEMKT